MGLLETFSTNQTYQFSTFKFRGTTCAEALIGVELGCSAGAIVGGGAAASLGILLAVGKPSHALPDFTQLVHVGCV